MNGIREFLCRLLGCPAFDRSASEIVDVATAEADQLRERLKGYEAKLPQGDADG